MRKNICGWILSLFTLAAVAWAIPTQLTYQGSLRENNVPVTDPAKPMRFRIVDMSQPVPVVLWQSPSMSVKVANGLFAVKLSPTNIAWESVSPSIEVEVNGQSLGPPEPISASVYANVSGTVVSGAITPDKVAPSYGLVPKGAIMMFAGNCPTSWTRFSALDGLFPLGSPSYGQKGGNDTHSHLLPIFQDGSVGPGFGAARPQDSPWGGQAVGGSVNITSFNQGQTLNNLIALQSGPAKVLPPYLSVIYCQKD